MRGKNSQLCPYTVLSFALFGLYRTHALIFQNKPFIHIYLIQFVLFRAIHLCNDCIYFKLHHYICLLNSPFLLAALVHFSCILIGQFRFRFLFLFRNSESAIFVAVFLVHPSSGGRLVCMVVVVWYLFVGTCLGILYLQVTGKVCFMPGN